MVWLRYTLIRLIRGYVGRSWQESLKHDGGGMLAVVPFARYRDMHCAFIDPCQVIDYWLSVVRKICPSCTLTLPSTGDLSSYLKWRMESFSGEQGTKLAASTAATRPNERKSSRSDALVRVLFLTYPFCSIPVIKSCLYGIYIY